MIEWDEAPEEPKRSERVVSYYQWYPVLLLAGLFLLNAPCYLWRWLSDKSGICVIALCDTKKTYCRCKAKQNRKVITSD